MNRVIFLVDGFNLYHSVVEASLNLRATSTKWLDIRSFCRSYLPALGKDATEEQIYYFSALAEHLIHSDSDTVNRHKSYIECLKSTGIVVELGRFKAKEIHLTICKSKILRHEEKETDVAISTKLFEVCFYNLCDYGSIGNRWYRHRSSSPHSTASLSWKEDLLLVSLPPEKQRIGGSRLSTF